MLQERRLILCALNEQLEYVTISRSFSMRTFSLSIRDTAENCFIGVASYMVRSEVPALVVQPGSGGNHILWGSVRPHAGKRGWLSWGETSGLLGKIAGCGCRVGAVA